MKLWCLPWNSVYNYLPDNEHNPRNELCQLCFTPDRRTRQYIQCDWCNMYYHMTCVKIKKTQADALPVWKCGKCRRPTIAPTNANPEMTNVDAGSQPMVDTPTPPYFIEEYFSGAFPEILAIRRRSRKVIPRIPTGRLCSNSRIPHQ